MRNDFVGTSELTKNLLQEFSKDMTMRWGMADDSYAKNLVWLVGIRGREGVQNIISPQATKCVSERALRHHKSLHKSSQYYVTRTGAATTWKTVILFTVINTFYTCQADVDTKMTVGMFMCMTQNGEMCTVGTSSCISREEAPRCMSMIWFSCGTSKSGDEQMSMKETCGLCEGNAEQHLLQHCFQLSGW